MTRVFVFVFALLAALILGVYWFAPGIATYLVTEQLRNSEVDLKSLHITELAPVRVRVSSAELNVSDMDIHAEGVEVHLIDDSEWVVVAESLAVSLLAGESSGPASTISELLSTVEESLGLVPKVGVIEQLEYCQPGTCVELSLGWRRAPGSLRVLVYFPTFDTHMLLEKREGWQVSLFGKQPQGTVLAEFLLAPVELLLEVTNTIWLKPGDITEMPPGVQLGNLKLNGVSRIPLSAPVDELLIELVSSNELTLAAEVEYVEPPLKISSQGEFQFGVGYQDQDIAISLLSAPEVQVEIEEMGRGLVTIGGENRCEFSLGLGGLDCDLAAITSSWDIDNQYGKYAADLNASQVNLTLKQNEPDVKGQIAIALFDLEQGQSVIEGGAAVTANSQQVSIRLKKGKLLGANFGLSASYKLASSSGKADVTWNASPGLGSVLRYGARKAQLEKTVRDITRSMAGGFELKSNVEFNLSSELALSHETELQLMDFRLNYDGYVLNNGYLALTASGWPKVNLEASVSGDSLDVGLPISNIKSTANAQLNADTSQFNLATETLSLELLGGRVLGHDLKYDSTDGLGSGVFALDRLLIKDMLALQKQAIEGSGVLSGSVPVQFKDGNVSVSEAYVAALAPGGYIRYLAEPSVRALAKTNPGIAVVLDAMEDFQYHTLQASVDYLPDGKMLAKTSVKGANPNYQGGRQVHLNLSLEENILVLLRSLRLGSDIAEKVSEKQSGKSSSKIGSKNNSGNN